MRVVVVDDEAVVRVGLKSMIDWQRNGYELLGEASDGKKALEMITKYRPDIVITDIKMPVMDGLQLIKQTLHILPETKILVLSSYSDFQLVKEAMRLGAADYCLKLEMEPENLLLLLNKIKETIKNSRNAEEKQSLMHEQIKRNMPIVRDEFLKNILSTDISEKEFHTTIDLLGISLEPTNIYCMLLKTGDLYKLETLEDDVLHRLNRSIRSTIEEIINDEYTGYCFEIKTGEFCVLLSFKNKPVNDLAEQMLQDTGYRLIDILKQYLDLFMIIGIGRGDGKGVNSIKSAYSEALKALKSRFFTDDGRVILWNKVPEPSLLVNNNFSILKYKDKLHKALAYQEEQSIQYVFSSILHDLDLLHLSQDMVCNVSLELVYMIAEFLEKYHFDIPSVLSNSYKSYRELMHMESISQIRQWVQETYEDLALFIKQRHPMNYPRIISKAQEYIMENISNNLSLKDVAHAVSLNPSYFSTIFKQYTGVNFTDYINEQRINKAKTFLTETEYKVYEIAQLVGYENIYYFNRIFKKICGMTPVGYKNAKIMQDK